MIPDFDDRTDPGHRRVNWLVFTPPPPGLDFTEPTSIPPGEVSAELYRHLDQLLATAFPADFQAVIRAEPARRGLDPADLRPTRRLLRQSRVMLIGDAGTVSRPHTGSGATKALQDALCLERLGQRARRVARLARRLRRRAHGSRCRRWSSWGGGSGATRWSGRRPGRA